MSPYGSSGLSSWVRRSCYSVLVVLGAGVVGLAGYGFILSMTLTLPKSDEHPPLLIYGAPFLLEPGLSVERSGLLDRLHRLEYRRVRTAPKASGEYLLTDDVIDLVLHAQEEAQLPARAVRLRLANGEVSEVLTLPDEQPASLVGLEPAVISGMRAGSKQVREWIPLSRIPPMLVQTLLAVEDRRFFSHYGIDPIAVARALWTNVTHGAVLQ